MKLMKNQRWYDEGCYWYESNHLAIQWWPRHIVFGIVIPHWYYGIILELGPIEIQFIFYLPKHRSVKQRK